MKKLNELSDGSCGRVVAINGDAHFQSRVTSIGLTIGCPFEVIQNPKKAARFGVRKGHDGCHQQNGI